MIIESSFDFGWAIGMLEGEGTFVIGKRQAMISVCTIFPDVANLEKLTNVFSMGRVNGPYKYKTNQTPYYMWTVSGYSNCYKLCLLIQPYMSPRRQAQIEKLITFLKDKNQCK